MKKQSKTTTVHRIDLVEGQYTTISRNILNNPNLRDSSKTLLNLSLNNIESWELRLCHYQKLLEWSNDKMTGAVANLIHEGYFKMKKHPRGKNLGFYYTYVISEFGNLNPNKETADIKEVKASLKDDQAETKEHTQDSIQQESNAESKPIQPKAVKSPVIDTDFEDKVLKMVIESVISIKDDNYITTVADYYKKEIEQGRLTPSNYDEYAIKTLLKNKVAKKLQPLINEFTQWIDLENDKGTKDQRANMKTKAILYFTELLFKGEEITREDVSLKMMKLRLSVIDTNRNLDQRYQN